MAFLTRPLFICAGAFKEKPRKSFVTFAQGGRGRKATLVEVRHVRRRLGVAGFD